METWIATATASIGSAAVPFNAANNGNMLQASLFFLV